MAEGMAFPGAKPVPGSCTTSTPGVMPSASWDQPRLCPAPGPVHQLYWQPPPPPPLGNAPVPWGNPVVLSALPVTPAVAGHGGSGLRRAGPFNTTAQAGRPARPLRPKSAVLTEAPLRGVPPGIQHRNVPYCAPLRMRDPPTITCVPAPTGVSIQFGGGMWPQVLCPPATPPVVSTLPGVNAGPPPPWSRGAGGLATSQANALPGHRCKSPSVYENFRHWQRMKTLVQRHLPSTPDMEAVSCFLLPVLRSLFRRRLISSEEEGLRIGVREWDRTSNYERMTFYKVAHAFMEFEAAEEKEHHRLQLMGGLPAHPSPAPTRPNPPGPAEPEPVQQPVHGPRQPPKTTAPDKVPPEAMEEYMELMDWLKKNHLLALEEPKEKQDEEQQEEEEDLTNPDIWQYCEELCSQKEFVDKAEYIINTEFLIEAQSTDAKTDILMAVEQVLEEEHKLTLDQLVEKRLQESQTRGGVYRICSQDEALPAACQDAQQEARDPKGSVDKETCPAPKASQVLKRRRATDEELPGPEVRAALRRRHSRAPLGASGASALPQDLAPRGAQGLGGALLTRGLYRSASCSEEGDRDLTSLDFLLASPRKLLPRVLLQPLGPDMGLLYPEGSAPQASLRQRGSLSRDFPPSVRSNKRVLTGGSGPVGKVSRPDPSCKVSGGQNLAQGTVKPAWPKKRRGNKLGSQRRRKNCPP